MRVTILIAVLAITTGCLPKNAFASPPETYKCWSKPGAGDVAIWKAMLECNYAEPFTGWGGGPRMGLPPEEARTTDQIVASMVCMERSGYSYRDGNKVLQTCQDPTWKKSLSCQVGAVIPVPEASRRLSSAYCKKYPQSRACVP